MNLNILIGLESSKNNHVYQYDMLSDMCSGDGAFESGRRALPEKRKPFASPLAPWSFLPTKRWQSPVQDHINT